MKVFEYLYKQNVSIWYTCIRLYMYIVHVFSPKPHLYSQNLDHVIHSQDI